MKIKNESTRDVNEFSVNKGLDVEAIYLEPQLRDYENNPLILSLPPIMDVDDAISQLAYFPEFDESIAAQPDSIRLHKLNNGLRLFSPLDVHLDLQTRISCLIRGGYIERNPLERAFNKRIGKAVKSISQYGNTESYSSTKYHGFNIIGVSGVGKTQTVERVLEYYPQVIRHSVFQGNKFTVNQLVWLKLDCPFDGSTKGLCLNFFQAVDRIFGTNYLRNYGSKRATVDEMLPSMAIVAACHHLGVLVIDEIQRLSLAKSGGADKMLNFFNQLVNSVGVPVIMVGTFKALELFSDNVSQARRGTGQGDLVWDRMAYDDQWAAFVDSLWDYQYTRHKVREGDKENLSAVLYEETQGITDLALKAFIFAQQRAIESREEGKEEKITPGIIRSVVKDKFKLLRPALEALRALDKNAMRLYEDLYPKFRGDYLANNPAIYGGAAEQPEIKSTLAKHSQNSAGKNEPEAKINAAAGEAEETLDSSINNVLSFLGNKKDKKTGGSGKAQNRLNAQNLLREVLKTEETPYGALLANGYVRNSSEFFEGGIN